MVDLSQDQPLKQEPKPEASVSPAGDQPPVAQPTTPPKQLDETPPPPIKDEEKIATPEQEEIKKELSELGIPPEGRGKKTKVILAALGVLLLIATLPAAVYLVKQRQDIRSAACRNEGDCVSWQIIACDNGTWKGRVREKGSSSWQEEELVINDNGCHQSPYFDYQFALSDGDWVEWELYRDDKLFKSKEYQVWNCPPTPVYKLECKTLKAYDESWEEITDFSTISVGDTVRFLVEGLCDEPQGITNSRFRINGGVWQDPTGKNWGHFYLEYEIPSANSYKIEAMVYNPNLGWF